MAGAASAKPSRAPTVMWALRKVGVYPNGFVRTLEDDKVLVTFHEEYGDVQFIKLGRRDARLLAKRINECLDQTRK